MKSVIIIERKLGREKALGQAYQGMNVVEIDPRQDERERMDTLIHELLHLMCPKWEEKKVEKRANWLCKHLWRQGYRRMRD